MRIFKHPSFPDITTNCDHDESECDHSAKGWVPLLTDEQRERFEVIAAEVEQAADLAELEADLAPKRRTKNPRR